jgi:hypothetical protein
MARNYHIAWVTRLGAMFIEKAEPYRDAEAAADASMRYAFNADIRQFTPLYIETIDGDFVGIIHPDHFIVMTPEEVNEMLEENDGD